MAYATVQQLLTRYDQREIGDLVSDDNNRENPIDLAGNQILSDLLDDASGQIEAALVVGKRYSATELAGLTGHSASHLARITCDIAVSLLSQRRLGALDAETRQAIREVADNHLERLRKGENVFNLTEQKEAGTPSIGGLSSVEYQNLNLIRDRVRNYYPARRLPDNR